jgi:hypothetical protein
LAQDDKIARVTFRKPDAPHDQLQLPARMRFSTFDIALP